MGILANMTREVKMVSKGEVNYTFHLQIFFKHITSLFSSRYSLGPPRLFG